MAHEHSCLHTAFPEWRLHSELSRGRLLRWHDIFLSAISSITSAPSLIFLLSISPYPKFSPNSLIHVFSGISIWLPRFLQLLTPLQSDYGWSEKVQGNGSTESHAALERQLSTYHNSHFSPPLSFWPLGLLFTFILPFHILGILFQDQCESTSPGILPFPPI